SIAREFKASRRATFATGRTLARSAMTEIGVAAGSVLRAPDGAPVWPSDCLGSISHSRAWVAAVAAQRNAYHGLGVDIEQRARVREHLFRRILTLHERDELSRMPVADQAERATWIFSAKEAVYKAVYPTLRRYIGFEAVEVHVTRAFDGDLSSAAAMAHQGHPTMGEFGRIAFRHVGVDADCGLIDNATGRLMVWHDQVIALVALPRSGEWRARGDDSGSGSA
ncbi:MAG: 4'-phosphopantetheinyl transferase, partial [Gammaproteobacteria bacterium]